MTTAAAAARATALAQQGALILEHLPEDEIAEDDELAYLTFAGGWLLIRRVHDGALFALRTDGGGVYRWTAAPDGSTHATHYRDRVLVSRVEAPLPAPIAVALATAARKSASEDE